MDVQLIAKELLSRINAEFREQEPGYVEKVLTPPALSTMRKHPWPGNVRELYNNLLQCAVMTEGAIIGRRDLAETAGNKTAAARLLGVKNYQTLDARMKRLKA